MKLCQILWTVSSLLAGLCSGFSADKRQVEQEYYPMSTIAVPAGVVLEAGGMQVLPNKRLAVCSRYGEIYLIDGAFDEDLSRVRFTRFAANLHEPLGLAWKDGWLYAMQRGEMTRIKDLNGDGKGDVFETFADGWGLSGDYHEYGFGSKHDREGNLWVVLCLTGSFTSEALYRGWCLRISPEGKVIPTCSGIRSPGGIGTNSLGDMFYTDNQGPWNGTSALKHLAPGQFMGHPTGNRWYSVATNLSGPPATPQSGSRMAVEAARIPELIPPAIYFPYSKMGQSASGIANDGTRGKFGVFTNQLFVGDQTHSTVMRVCLEKVNNRYQGACFPFREGFDSGTLSLEFSDDGFLFVGGTDRGWGARGGKPFALQRLKWSGKRPFEIEEVKIQPEGFTFTFTETFDPKSVENTESWKVQTYTYVYQANYGSPEVDQTAPVVTSVKTDAHRRSATITLSGQASGHVHEIHLPGVRSAKGAPLLHPVAYYTANYWPSKSP